MVIAYSQRKYILLCHEPSIWPVDDFDGIEIMYDIPYYPITRSIWYIIHMACALLFHLRKNCTRSKFYAANFPCSFIFSAAITQWSTHTG